MSNKIQEIQCEMMFWQKNTHTKRKIYNEKCMTKTIKLFAENLRTSKKTKKLMIIRWDTLRYTKI